MCVRSCVLCVYACVVHSPYSAHAVDNVAALPWKKNDIAYDAVYDGLVAGKQEGKRLDAAMGSKNVLWKTISLGREAGPTTSVGCECGLVACCKQDGACV